MAKPSPRKTSFSLPPPASPVVPFSNNSGPTGSVDETGLLLFFNQPQTPVFSTKTPFSTGRLSLRIQIQPQLSAETLSPPLCAAPSVKATFFSAHTFVFHAQKLSLAVLRNPRMSGGFPPPPVSAVPVHPPEDFFSLTLRRFEFLMA